jgi:HSP20 family protein
MYGSSRQGSRSLLGDILGFDPTSRGPEAYGLEIERTDNGYRIEVPVPGFRPEEIHVTVEDRQLTIEGRAERRRFTRAIVLPEEIDADKIEAHVEHGMLALTLPLHAKMQPRRIDVRVGGQQMKNVSGTTESGTAESGGGTVPSVSGESQGQPNRTPQETT